MSRLGRRCWMKNLRKNRLLILNVVGDWATCVSRSWTSCASCNVLATSCNSLIWWVSRSTWDSLWSKCTWDLRSLFSRSSRSSFGRRHVRVDFLTQVCSSQTCDFYMFNFTFHLRKELLDELLRYLANLQREGLDCLVNARSYDSTSLRTVAAIDVPHVALYSQPCSLAIRVLIAASLRTPSPCLSSAADVFISTWRLFRAALASNDLVCNCWHWNSCWRRAPRSLLRSARHMSRRSSLSLSCELIRSLLCSLFLWTTQRVFSCWGMKKSISATCLTVLQ